MPNRTIRDIIAHQKVLSAPASMTVREAAIRMAESKVGAMPRAPRTGFLRTPSTSSR